MTKVSVGLVLVGLVAGCGVSTQPGETTTEPANGGAELKSMAVQPANVAVARSRPAITGIRTCDSFLRRYDLCIQKRLRGEVQAKHKEIFAKERERLIASASDQKGRDELYANCKQAINELPSQCRR